MFKKTISKRVLIRSLGVCGLLCVLFVISTRSSSFVLGYADESYIMDGQERICAGISQGFFFRIGDTADQLGDRILRNPVFEIDGISQSDSNYYILDLLVAGVQYDPFGLKIAVGTVGGPLTFCTSTAHLPVGQHVARIIVEGHDFSWTFTISRLNGTYGTFAPSAKRNSLVR